MKFNELTKEIEENIVEMYKSGATYVNIKKKFNISPQNIKKILLNNGVEIRSKGGKLKSKLPEKEIVYKYTVEYKSSVKLAEEYGVSWTTILNVLKRNNITNRNNNVNRLKNLSLLHNYFDTIDSLDKAYFLGILITDGFVYEKRDTVSLDISKKDEYLVKLFSDTVKNKNKFQYRKDKSTVRISFESKQMKKALSRFGVIPNKTGKEYLPILNNKSLMPHLIRGIFDGDGWITSSNSKGRFYLQIGLCGNKNFVEQVRDFLVNEINVKKVKVIQTNRTLWQVTWSSKKDFNLICDYIYKDKKQFFLPRKYKKFMAIPR